MGSYNRRTDTRRWPSSHLHYHNFHPVDTVHRRPRLHHSRNRHAPNNRCPLTTHPSTRNSIRRQPRNGPWTAQLLPGLRTIRTPHPPNRRRSRKHSLSLPSRTHRPLDLCSCRRSLLPRLILRRLTVLAPPVSSAHRLPPGGVSTERRSVY